MNQSILAEPVFGSLHAACYDDLYGGLDYAANYEAVKLALNEQRRFAAGRAPVLDIGCGTGEFTRRLSDDGEIVIGVDQSAAMLDIARVKCQNATFYLGRTDNFAIDTPTFGAAIMMGGVLGYQDTNHGVLAALRNIRAHLRTGGVLVLDVWNGNAVLTHGAGERVRVVPTTVNGKVTGGETIRSIRGTLEYDNSVCVINYVLWRELLGRVEKVEETHRIRYFMPAELDFFLSTAGFSTMVICSFPDRYTHLNADHWHMMAVAIVPDLPVPPKIQVRATTCQSR